jgi:hypothetical protein
MDRANGSGKLVGWAVQPEVHDACEVLPLRSGALGPADSIVLQRFEKPLYIPPEFGGRTEPAIGRPEGRRKADHLALSFIQLAATSSKYRRGSPRRFDLRRLR